ncbi:unnamed protein product [Ectocarpus sp. 13 AM-2016]
MRLSEVLSVLNLAAVAQGGRGTAGWGSKSAAVMSDRRVFNDRHRQHQSRSAVAFFGRRPRTTTPRVIGSSEAESAVDALSDASGAGAKAVRGSPPAADISSADSTGDSAAAPSVSAAQGIVNTFRDFWGHARHGTFALWGNFQARRHTSQDIRKRVKAGHVMTYAEHAHLERGATDRRKLLQYLIAYAVSPKNFVYVVWYVPGLLPSTFVKPHTIRSKYHRLALERASATWDAVTGLEFRLLKAEEGFKGKRREEGSRQSKKMEKLERQREMVLDVLEADGKRQVFERFQEHMVVPAPASPDPENAAASNNKGTKKSKKPKPQKLKLPPASKGVPNTYIKALGKGTGLSGWWHISPGFYVRYCLSERLRDLGRMDDVLRTVSLESLSDSDLREACDARAINVGNRLGGDREPRDLRKLLGEWLDLTSPEVAAGSKLGPDTVFLPDRARLLGLGLNCLESARQGRTAELPRKALAVVGKGGAIA